MSSVCLTVYEAQPGSKLSLNHFIFSPSIFNFILPLCLLFSRALFLKIKMNTISYVLNH
jgi:hypothetical protein